jgi:hypothetical protein
MSKRCIQLKQRQEEIAKENRKLRMQARNKGGERKGKLYERKNRTGERNRR